MGNERQKYIFSKNLLYYLSLRELSQKEFADKLGFSPQTVNVWCKGTSVPNMSKVQLIADCLGIETSDLIFEHNFSESESKKQLELISLFNQLDDAEQGVILATMRSLVSQKSSNDKD